MNLRILSTAMACSILFASATLAQPPGKSGSKGGEKGGDKKAPAPKTPADLAFDEFNKVRGPK